MKKISTLLAMAVLAFGAHAGAMTVGEQVPVEMVVPTTITQVVAFDGKDTFVMATAQKVDTVVTVTPEMANKAQVFSVTGGTLPEITSVAQAADTGEFTKSQKPFGKLGSVEPIATSKTVVNTVYFKDGEQMYTVETVQEVGDTLTLTKELIAGAKKSVVW